MLLKSIFLKKIIFTFIFISDDFPPLKIIIDTEDGNGKCMNYLYAYISKNN